MTNSTILKVGKITFSIELPDYIYAAVTSQFPESEITEFPYWASAEVANCLRSIIPSEERPSSAKQIEYAAKIASHLEIELPESILQSESCGAFIDSHEEAFKKSQAQERENTKYLKHLFRQTGRVSRWQKARSLATKHGVEATATEMGVRPNTVEKYLNELAQWEEETRGTDEYEVVMNLLEEYDSGTDLYEKYLYGTVET